MTNKNDFSDDAYVSIRLALYTLIRNGVPVEDIVANLNKTIQELVDSDDITLLSTDALGMVKESHLLVHGELTFDTLKRTLYFKGQEIVLSPHQSLTLGLFFKHPNTLITHQEIVDYIYEGNESDNNPSGLCRPIISRLRKNLNHFPGGKEWIETVRGKGYFFRLEQ